LKIIKSYSASKRILVIGATGFLGANLVSYQYPMEEYEIIGIGRKVQPEWFTGKYHQKLDFSERAINSTIESLKPDVIVNCAAITSHDACESNPDLADLINTKLAVSLAKSALDNGAKFVQISSDAVFSGMRVTEPYREGDITSPFSKYGETKLRAEIGILDINSNALIIRVNFFGWSPGGHRSILEFIASELLKGNQIEGFTDYIVTSQYVETLLRDTYELFERDISGVVHLSSKDAVSKFDFGLLVAKEFGLKSELITPTLFGKSDTGTAVSRSRNLMLDSSFAEELLGRDRQCQLDGIKIARERIRLVPKMFHTPPDDWRNNENWQ